MNYSCSQSWAYSKKYPKGKPIFFENGKRVSFQCGEKMFLAGKLGDAVHLKKWFKSNRRGKRIDND
jgi:hypothetical protein